VQIPEREEIHRAARALGLGALLGVLMAWMSRRRR